MYIYIYIYIYIHTFDLSPLKAPMDSKQRHSPADYLPLKYSGDDGDDSNDDNDDDDNNNE
jgi:hypothetical protein